MRPQENPSTHDEHVEPGRDVVLAGLRARGPNEVVEPTVQREFKAAMRRLASTVAVVSAACDGETYGMTLTAVTSYSMDPPSLVVCVNRNASIHAVLAGCAGQRFCVNVLGEGHQDVAAVFAGALPRDQRFGRGEWLIGDDHTPYLADAQCNLFARVHSALTVFSHSLIVATVEAVRCGQEVRPLIYADGRYGRVAGA